MREVKESVALPPSNALAIIARRYDLWIGDGVNRYKFDALFHDEVAAITLKERANVLSIRLDAVIAVCRLVKRQTDSRTDVCIESIEYVTCEL
jgi:hypothetical protein